MVWCGRIEEERKVGGRGGGSRGGDGNGLQRRVHSGNIGRGWEEGDQHLGTVGRGGTGLNGEVVALILLQITAIPGHVMAAGWSLGVTSTLRPP